MIMKGKDEKISKYAACGRIPTDLQTFFWKKESLTKKTSITK